MKELTFCAILMILQSRVQADNESKAEQTFVSEFAKLKILTHHDELTDYHKALLFKFAINNFEGYQKNVVLLNNHCSICDRILGVLMNASVQSFLTINDFSVVNYTAVKNATEGNPVIQYDGFVVFLMENVSEFLENFTKLQSTYAWNPRASHLSFIAEKPDDQELELIFKECWSNKVLNAAVVIWNQEEAYTYNPFLKNDFQMLEKVQNWSGLFYDKLRNMNGYPIRTQYIPFSSNDVAEWIEKEARYKFISADFGYSEAFFQSVNATPRFINLSNDMVMCYQDYSYRYTIWKRRKFNGAELWMNCMPFQTPLYDRWEKAYPLRSDNVRILSPKSRLKIPSVFEPYDNITWTCVLLSLVIFALYSYVLYRWRRIDDNAFLRTFGIFLGKNLANREMGLLEKFTFLVFTMTSLLILSAYQGALYSALATISYYPEIDTMPQLQERVTKINAYRLFAEYLQTYAQLNISVVEFGTIDYVEYMKAQRDEAFAFPNNMAQVTAKLKNLSANGVPFYHVMNEYSYPAFVSHAAPYGSPYLTKLEKVFLTCKEAGLDQYWEAEINLHAILSGTIISDVAEERPLKKLTLYTQLVVFYILGGGLFISFLCLTAEIYFYGNFTLI